MDHSELLKRIAPCSLMCHTCGVYKNGVICKAADQLFHAMDGVAEFYAKHDPAQAASFRVFHETLKNYGSGPCSGCRDSEHNGCSIDGCFILACTRAHGVEFCGECSEFPCSKTSALFEDEVYRQWLSGNQAIQQSGVEAFWENNREKPHYQAYKRP